MKKIDRVIADLKKHGSIPIYTLGEGVFLHSTFCYSESIVRDFCPSYFGMENSERCEAEDGCKRCWDEEIDTEYE